MEANSPEQQPENTTAVEDSLFETSEEQQGDEETFGQVKMTKEKEVSELGCLNGSDLGHLNGDKRSGSDRSNGPLKDDLNGDKRFGLSNIELNEVPGPRKNEVNGDVRPIITGHNHQTEKRIKKIGLIADHVGDGIRSQGNLTGERRNTQIKSNMVNRVKVSTNNGDKSRTRRHKNLGFGRGRAL
ncbi:hypothetical protein L6452_36705 [Arctium lappa]|uniref:Uncharacterized protein n=1 Tax=Arctium lappa TaxID=4217 RepID=A0ACB8YAK5_ARCLA|nr:hypothetical protein L6452_36705 [Arctium lappa]